MDGYGNDYNRAIGKKITIVNTPTNTLVSGNNIYTKPY